MKLTKLPPDDPYAVRAYIDERLARLDTTPRSRTWRRNALGMDKADAIAEAPRFSRIGIRLTVSEVRVLRHCAARRDMTLSSWLRAALATAAVACDDVPIDEVPTLATAGLLGRHG